jgi:hypothetical protein
MVSLLTEKTERNDVRRYDDKENMLLLQPKCLDAIKYTPARSKTQIFVIQISQAQLNTP